LTIIEQYNGVIIADVVGLGKSIISGMLAHNLGKRGMVICPPGLMGDARRKDSGWHKYVEDFKLYGWEVRSSGDLEKAAEYLQEHGDDVEVIIVDEAHRFRNEDTADYEWLSTICRNRIVILLTPSCPLAALFKRAIICASISDMAIFCSAMSAKETNMVARLLV